MAGHEDMAAAGERAVRAMQAARSARRPRRPGRLALSATVAGAAGPPAGQDTTDRQPATQEAAG